MADRLLLGSKDESALSARGGFDLGGSEPLERRTVPDQLAQRFLSLVRSGNLKAGDKLPPETEIASAFQISRPTVREALKMLCMLGIAESRQGGRYYITDLSTTRLIRPIQFVVMLQDYDISAHLEAREAVDIELLRLACERATPEEIEKLQQLARTGHDFIKDPVGFRLLDYEFHQTINSAARSPMLARIALSLYELCLELRRVATETPGVIDVSVGDHDAIVAGIAKRKPEIAISAYRTHLRHTRETTVMAAARLRPRNGAPSPDAALLADSGRRKAKPAGPKKAKSERKPARKR